MHGLSFKRKPLLQNESFVQCGEKGAFMNTDLMFSSKSNEWETPQELFDKLDNEFNFTLDVCASEENAKVDTFHTIETDGLTSNWQGHTCFMNPPYGREIGKWIKKAYEESRKKETTVVCLIPSRTDTKYFHDYCLKGEIRFLRGRLLFRQNGIEPTKDQRAPFPSMIVIFK